MGYYFEFAGPSARGGLNLNVHQMGIVREIMREAGAAAGQGLEPALRIPGLEPVEETVDIRKFASNDDWHVTADEARFVAARLRLALEHDVPGEYLLFFDDAPPAAEVRSWVAEFADFNERSAAHGGYRVR